VGWMRPVSSSARASSAMAAAVTAGMGPAVPVLR